MFSDLILRINDRIDELCKREVYITSISIKSYEIKVSFYFYDDEKQLIPCTVWSERHTAEIIIADEVRRTIESQLFNRRRRK